MKTLSSIQQTMSSREIAELTGKTHAHIMRDIRNMEEAWIKTTGTKFGLSDYTDTTGRKLPMYQLSKSECLYVATKFNDEARAKLVVRWEHLEKKAIDFNDPNTVLQLAKNWKEERDRNIQLKQENDLKQAILVEQNRQIREAAPKVAFAEAVECNPGSLLVREYAKTLCDQGYNIGEKRMFEWLRSNGYVNKRNEPYQRFVDAGLFEVDEFPVSTPNIHFLRITPRITGKGQVYFSKKLLHKQLKLDTTV